MMATTLKRSFMAALLAVCAALLACTLTACDSPSKEGPVSDQLTDFPVSDMSGYSCAADYKGEYRFVGMTMAEVDAKMSEGATFALFCGFDDCPWCNVMLNPLNDVATERETHIGYIDLRKNPAWETNLDLEDYDLLVERFGDALGLDDQNRKHLYAPHVFFVKDGKMVADHDGTVPSQADPAEKLTDEQLAELKAIYNDCFGKLL